MKRKVGIIGAGFMAKSHLWALKNLPFYYSDCPKLELVAVTSSQINRSQQFAKVFGITKGLDLDQFFQEDFDSLIIAGPCDTHFEHLQRSLEKKGLIRIYIEKPLVSSEEELQKLKLMDITSLNTPKIQLGFQFLQMSAIQKARELFKEIGTPIHFKGRYLHSSYLHKNYRDKKQSRLQSAPAGGVTSDLASHLFSLLISFLGRNLTIKSALTTGSYSDVVDDSDLCTHILLKDLASGAIGDIDVSRISCGCGDYLSLEFYGEKGSLRFCTEKPDSLFFFREGENWQEISTSSDFGEDSSFPSPKVSAGWLRSLVHAHSLFFAEDNKISSSKNFIPDLEHGIAVQKLVNDAVLNHLYNNKRR